MRIIRILLIFALFLSQGLGDEVFRKKGESSAKTTTKTTKTTNQSAKSSDFKKHRDLAKDSNKKSNTQKSNSQKTTAPKITPNLEVQTKHNTQKTTKSTNQNTQKSEQSPKSIKKVNKVKKITKKKPLGYRNVTIKKIKKQQKVGVDFFIGLQFGIDIVSMQDITQIDIVANTKHSITTSASFGLKGGILSEDEWVGGRFYAELSYLKIPKFDMLNIGVNLDLLVKYYETPSWKIGGFIGAGGGMNSAFVADKSLDSAGTKSLISVGWVNIGLMRFIYGNHGAELNAKIVYVTPTIYSLKDKNTGITTSYKGSSSTVMLSYTYQF